ncbi:MAG TPA: protein translocase subunit SecD [Dehalococcoidia bacterium]|nr:protein translocase subunit SecD [Dehalococcoidia bacterium]
MRSRSNRIIFAFVVALTVVSVIVVWPDKPKRYLPDFVPWPSGQGASIFGWDAREGMRLGLDLKGGTYVLLEADTSRLPPGTDIGNALDGVKDVLERRVNAFGVSETEITREGPNRLAVQMPGIDPTRARELLGKTAQLEFRAPVRDETGQIVCESPDGSTYAVPFQAGGFIEDSASNTMTCPPSTEGAAGVVKWEPATGTDSQGVQRVLTGSYLRPNAGVVGPPVAVAIEFTSEGGLLFEQITGGLVGLPLGIFLDEELIGAPTVQQQITGGSSTITGLALDEAKTLAIQLNAGALPVPMRAIQETEVDATLGEHEVIRTVQAGLIGILAVMAFMVLYYRLPGVLAAAALGVYVSFVLMLFKIGPIIGPVTITLAGIAGFVLSVGMAVDANVLVFERLKEELRAGRNLMGAIEHGFDRAWSSIRDSNVSTLITCVILYWFGDQFGASLVKGFALTLGIGVLVSMFTALTVTRTFLRLLVGTPLARNAALFGAAPEEVGIGPAAAAAVPDGASRRAGRSTTRGWSLNFVHRRGFYYVLSIAVLVPGIISLLVPPSLKPGIEFSSGATFTVEFADKSVSPERVRDVMTQVGHSEARVQSTSGGGFIIRTGELEGLAGPPVGPRPPSERDQIEAGFAELGEYNVTNFNQVSEIVSTSIGRNAAIAVGAAALAILLYISYSFRNVPKAYRYGIAAVIAAGHDGLVVLGVFSILGKVFDTEINTMFITGLLTIIGFSVHDTIVVFDRIRENAATYRDAPFDEIVNVSLTETMARSLNTSITVLFAVVALLLLGGSTIQSFLLVLLVGVVAGTYSSIFVASQILVSWEEGDLPTLWRRLLPRRPLPAPEA